RLARRLTRRGVPLTRRELLRAGLSATAVSALLSACAGAQPAPSGPAPAGAAAGGSGASPPPASPIAPATGRATTGVSSGPLKLVLVQAGEPSTLDPQFEQSGAIGTALNPMLEHLMEFDRNLAIKNVLAETSQQPTDGVTYRFKLRPNMK